MADSDRHDDDNEGRQDTRLLQQIVIQLQQANAKLNTIIGQNNQIISLLTPAPSDDITTLGGTISKPVHK